MRSLFPLALACIVGCLPAIAQRPAELVAPKIEAIRAMPYYPATGEIERGRDLFDPKLVLRNVIIGEGDVKSSTTTTYVEVEIRWPKGPLDKDATGAQVELEARAGDGKRLVQKQVVSVVSIATADGDVFRVPFFVYDTGCEKLQLTARGLLNGRVDNTKSRTIPFGCGE